MSILTAAFRLFAIAGFFSRARGRTATDRRGAHPLSRTPLAGLCGLVFLALGAGLQGATLYVNSSAPAGGDGNSWATAYDNLQSALARADGVNATEIWIADGVYKPTTGGDRTIAFTARSNLTLRGGFVGNETSAAARPEAAGATRFTVLSGDIGTPQPDAITATSAMNDAVNRTFDMRSAGAKDNSYNVVVANNVTGFVLDRIVVANGYADSTEVNFLKIQAMLLPTTANGAGFQEPIDSRVCGAGIFAWNSGVLINQSWIIGNYARGLGGGVASRGGGLWTYDSQFVSNISAYGGGGLSAQGGALALDRNLFQSNVSAFLGGGVLIQEDTSVTTVKAYIVNLLNGLSTLTYGKSDDPPPADTQINPALSYEFFQDALVLGQRALSDKLSTLSAEAIALKLAESTATKLVKKAMTSAFSGGPTPLGGAYAAISTAVAVLDFGALLAVQLGVDPNDPVIQTWATISDYATYATPEGLGKLIVQGVMLGLSELERLLLPGKSFAERATALVQKDYLDNLNRGALVRLDGNRFEKNYSAGFGGGASVIRANVVFNHTYFVENESMFDGGAGAFFGYNQVHLRNSAVLDNVATFGHSGLLYAFRSVGLLVHATVTGNHSAYANGYAVGVDTGGDVSIANSILWDNTNGSLTDSANVNRTGGADVFATRREDLDTLSQQAYNDAGDMRGLFTGVCDIQFSDVESLDRLRLGTAVFHTNVDQASFDSARAAGMLAVFGYPNVGEGIAAIADRGNIARNPLLVENIIPHPYSPVVDTGSTAISGLYAEAFNHDLLGILRRATDPVDMGAVESSGSLPPGTRVYLNHGVTASGDGLSWAGAKKTLSEVLALPLGPGVQVWVAEGTYTVGATAELQPGVSLIGGFVSGATSVEESSAANITIISGEIGNAGTADNSPVLLTGITTVGDTYENHQRKLFGHPRYLQHLRFVGANGTGAAVRLAVPVIIKSCVFADNTGLRALEIVDTGNYYTEAEAKVIDSTFERNTGGALLATSSNLTVLRSQFYDNTASTGGAIFKNEGADNRDFLHLERNVFYGNQATAGRGGAVYYQGGRLTAAHNVFADNTAQPASDDTTLTGGAGLWWGVAEVFHWETVNNIFHGNRILGSLASATPLEFQQFGVPAIASYTFTQRIIRGNSIEGLLTIAVRGGSEGNVDYDPFFVNAAAHNFELSTDSLLANRGVDYASSDNTVINGSRDIGVAEGVSTVVRPLGVITLTANKPTLDGRTFTIQASDLSGDAGSFVWEVFRPGAIGFVTVNNDTWHSGATTGTLSLINPLHTWNGSIYRLRYTDSARVYTNDVVFNTDPAILYVAPTAAGSGNGTTWSNAFGSLSPALAIARPYTQIWIKAGSYAAASEYLTPGIRVYGGFAGTETQRAQRVADANVTTLSFAGDAQFLLQNTATWPSDNSAVLTLFDALTITGPQATRPAFYFSKADTALTRVTFNQLAAGGIFVYQGKSEIVDSSFDHVAGSAIATDSAALTLAGGAFTTNSGYAGAVFAINGTTIIRDSSFLENSGTNTGAVYIQGGTLDVQRSRFVANHPLALNLLNNASVRVANSLLARNTSSGPGGAISANSSTLNLVHVTLAQNSSSNAGGAIFLRNSGLSLVNSIVWGNSATLGKSIYGGAYASTLTHNQDQASATHAPLFDPTSEDFALSPHSPLLNVGGTDDALSGVIDLSGNVRRHAAGAADLGASEYQGAAGVPVYFTSAPADQIGYDGRSVTFPLVGGIGSPTATSTFDWTYFDGTHWLPISTHPAAPTLSGSSLTFPAVSLAMDGLQLRIGSSQTGVIATVTLTVLPRAVLRVDGRVATSGNGSTWATAFKTIASALTVANANTDLWIAGGDYPETALSAHAETRFYVGFAGTESSVADRDPVARPVRLVGSASHLTLVPDNTFTLPALAFSIVAAPADLSRYVDRPAVFVARADGTNASALVWQYLDGSTWSSIANLPGWTTSQVGEVSTLSHPSVTLAQNGLTVRAVVPGTHEASFPATLTVKARVNLYVDAAVSASGNGLSWPAAFKTIGEALAIADDGSDIWIATGNYTESALRHVPGSNLYATPPVVISGPVSTIHLSASAANAFRYTLASAVRSRPLYIGQPSSVSVALAATDAPVEWQYLNGGSWLPLAGVDGWTVVPSSGLTSKLTNPAVPASSDGLQVRVAVPSTGEFSAPVTLSVGTRRIVYVNQTRPASGNGLTWGNAFKTVREALMHPDTDDGTDIWIAAGTYDENDLSVPAGVNLYGGFDGTEAGDDTGRASRDAAEHVVTLRNSAGSRVLDVSLSGTEFTNLLTLIDSVTILGGTSVTEPAVYVAGPSIAFESVTFTQAGRAVFVEGADTSVEFNRSTFTANVEAVVAAGSPFVTIDDSAFTANTRALTTAAGVNLSVTGAVFSLNTDYAISAAPGFTVEDSTFTGNARDVVVEGASATFTQILNTTFANATVRAITSASPVNVVDSGFSGIATVAVELTGQAAASTLTRATFTNNSDAVNAPAGLTVTDSTFTGNVRGVVLSASGSAVSTITGGGFAHTDHNGIGIQSAGAIKVADVSFSHLATGISLSANADASTVSGSTFTGNTTGVASVSGLSIVDGTFSANATGVSIAGGSLGTSVTNSTFTSSTIVGIASDARLSTDTVVFNNSTLGVSLTGGSGVSRFVATTFADNVAGLNVATPARAEIVDSAFTGNTGISLQATGVELTSNNVAVANVVVTHSAFTHNTGPAVVVSGGYHRIERSTFTDNTTPGALIRTSNAGTARGFLGIGSSLIARNTSGDSTIRTESGSLNVTASTLADNETCGVAGVIDGPLSSSSTVQLSILWGNRASLTVARVELMQATTRVIINRSIIEGLQSSYLWIQPSANNLASDPLFVDARAGNYALQALSPAIDFGDTLNIGHALDITGNVRAQSTAIDLGAYESAYVRDAVPLKLTFLYAPRTLVVGDAATYTAAFAEGNGRTIRWQVNDGNGWIDLVADANHAFSYANGALRLVVNGDFSLSGYRYRAVINDGSTDIYLSPDSVFTVIPRPIYYVNAAATGTNTGASWTDAFTTLEAALNIAPAFSDIRVAGGTYRAPAGSSFQLRNSQRLLGGWDATTDTVDPLNQESILSSALGAPAGSVILVNNGLATNQTLVDGFTFTDGGIGIVLNLASPVVRNSSFVNLTSGIVLVNGQVLVEDSDFTGNTGSAIVARGGDADLTIVGCEFHHNTGGGAIALGNSLAVNEGSQHALITDSVFSGNSAVRGGAIHSVNFGSAIVVERSQFLGNTASTFGGAISGNSDNSITIRQSLFSRNQATDGSAIETSGTASLIYTTVADNHATTPSGVSVNSVRGLVVRDSILWGNTAAGAAVVSDDYLRLRSYGGVAVFSDSIIQGLSATTGTRLLPFDPKFADAANGDYRLAADSPALGLGQTADLLSNETDLDGVIRPAGGAADLGAYESAATPAPTYSFDLPATVAPNVGSGFTLTQISPAGFTSVWEYSTDNGATWLAFNAIGQPSTGPVGAHSYTSLDGTSRVHTLAVSQVENSLNGLLIRFQLTANGTTYTAPTVAVTVPSFDVIYVDASVSASDGGTTWARAYKTLAEGLAAVNSSRRIIYVAEGTYRGPFLLPMRFEIYGGFPAGGGEFASRNPSAHPSILTGLPAVVGDPRASAVVRLVYSGSGYTQPVVDGFTVENGQTGILADANVTPTLRNLIVRNHTATGLVVQGTTVSIEDAVFENNTGVNGGGIRAAGIVTLERVILRGNSATTGGGLWALSATLRNVLVSGNTATTGGGLWVASDPVFIQTTLAGNRAVTHPAAYVGFGTASFANSIVWGNRTLAGVATTQLAPGASNPPATFALDHTIVEQSSLSGALLFDPIFNAPVAAASAPSSGGDYTLRAVSPAIDAGSNTVASGIATDLAGQARITGAVDLGAYESATTASAPLAITSLSAALIFDREQPANNVFTVTATNASSIVWQYAGPDGVWISLVGIDGFSGANTGSLTITDANVALNGYRFRALITGADGSVVTSDERLFTIYAPNVYVNANRAGDEVGDGLSWATAYKSLDAAIASIPAVPASAEIWIAAGTYAPATTFKVRAGLSLYGGFAGTETLRADRDPSLNVTSLIGTAGQPAIVEIPATPTLSVPARLDGLTLRDSSSRGLYSTTARSLVLERVIFSAIAQGAVELANNADLVIRSCEFNDNGGASSGKAPLYIRYGTALIEDTLFTRNSAANFNNDVLYAGDVTLTLRGCDFIDNGAAHSTRPTVSVFGGSSLIEHTRFIGNHSADNILSFGSNTTIRFTEFRGNESTSGGPVVFRADATTVIENSLFAGNKGGGTFVGSTTFTHVTVADNLGSMLFLSNATTISNSIFWGNRSASGAISGVNSTDYNRLTMVRNSIVEAKTEFERWFVAKESNVEAAPDFTSAMTATAVNTPNSTGDYTLASGSSEAVDLGSNSHGTTGLDLAGNSRLHALQVDAGAYEYQGEGIYTIVTQPVDSSSAFTVEVSRNATYVWEESSDVGATFSAVSGSAYLISSTARTSMLTVTGAPEIEGRLFRVRVQFTSGPLVISDAVTFAYLTATASVTMPAGYATPGTLTATANAAPSSWQWQLSTDGATFANIASATSATLTVAADASPANTYRIRATYAAGPVIYSNAIALAVTDVSSVPASAVSGIAENLAFGVAGGGVDPASLTDASLFVHAGLTGRLTLADLHALEFSGDNVSLRFNVAPHAGERIQVTTTSLLRPDGLGIRPRVWEFRTPVTSGEGAFNTPVVIEPASAATAFALGDFNDDGPVDALVATASGLQLHVNDGPASFVASGTAFGPSDVLAIATGSLTSSGALDAAAVTGSGDVQIWTNNGEGSFTLAQTLTSLDARALVVGDVDADGDLDLVVTTTTGTRVLVNNGGVFVAGTAFDAVSGNTLAIGDLNQDGTLDLVVSATDNTAVWLSNGAGVFTTASTTGEGFERIALVDLDTDGHIDVVLVASNRFAQLWRNLGNAVFESIDSSIGGGSVATLATGDTDGDGRADLVVTDYLGRTGAWTVSTSLVGTRYPNQSEFTLGAPAELVDLDGDGALDLFSLDADGQPVVARYSRAGVIGDEDTTFAIAGAGFRPTPYFQAISITSRPAHGTLFIAGQPISVTPNQYGSYGDFNIQNVANVVYQPDANFDGIDSFTWRNALGEPSHAYAIIVRDVADPVIARDDAITTLEGNTVAALDGGAASVLANDDNEDAGDFEATLVLAPSNGTLTLNADGTFIYVHDGSRTTSDQFSYRATNLSTNSNAVATVSITIARHNLAPDSITLTAAPGTHYTDQPVGEIVATLVATDADPEDGGLLTLSLVSGEGASDNAQFVIEDSSLKTAALIQGADGDTRSIRIRATDTLGLFIERVFTVTFTRPPAALAATLSTSEDVSLPIQLSGTGGNSGLAYQLVDIPKHGTLSLTADPAVPGAYLYTPNANYAGTDTFSFRVADSLLNSASAVVTIVVAEVNDTPLLAPVAPITIDEDAVATFTLVGEDADDVSLLYELVGATTFGTVQITGSVVTYTPNPNAHGVETLNFTASDTVNTSAPISVVITVNSVNDAPVIAALAPRTVQRNRVDTFTPVLTDAEGDSITLRLGAAPQQGSVVISGHAVTYTPATGYTGPDSFSLIASDGTLDSAPAVVAVTVASIAAETVNLAVYRGLYEYTEIPAYTGVESWSTAVVGDLSSPAHGTVHIEDSGVVYDHNGDDGTADTFIYSVTNDDGDIRTITVVVTIKDRVLDVTSGSFDGAGSLHAAIELTNRFAGDTLSPGHTESPDWLINIQPSAGSASLLLNTDYEEAYSFSFFRILGRVTVDAAASPGFTLTGYFPGRSRHFLVMPDASLTLKHLVLLGGESIADPLWNRYPVSRGGSILNFGTFTAEDVAFRSNNADEGAAIYNEGGVVSLTDCVFEDNFITEAGASGGIVISRNGSLSFVRGSFADNDGQTHGDVYVVGYNDLATVSATATAISSVKFFTHDGGSLAVTGLPGAINDALVYTIGSTLAIEIDALLANDLGTPAASITVAGTSSKGVAVLRNGGSLSYQAPADVSGGDSFTYTITDAGGNSSTATVVLSFVNAPALPRGVADTGTVFRGLSAEINVLANDTDDTGASLTISAASTPARGVVEIINDGTSIRYTSHDTTENASVSTDSFTYNVTNSTGTTENVAVTVTINERVIDVTDVAALQSALNFVRSQNSSTLAPARTAPPDWTLRILAGADQIWETNGDDGQGSSDARSAFRITARTLVTIDASESSNFSLSSSLPYMQAVRNFTIDPDARLTLKNLRMAGGNSGNFANSGGSVLNQGTFIAEHVVFQGHIAAQGAAIYNDGGTVTLTDCAFLGNSVMNYSAVGGGVVHSQNGTLSLTRTTFENFANPEVYVMADGQTATVRFDAAPTYSYHLETSSGGSVITPGFPRLMDDEVTRPSGKTFKLPIASLLLNDTGANEDGVTVSFSEKSARHITLTRSGVFLLYQAPASFNEDDSFTYTVTSSIGISSTATVHITVTAPSEEATIAPAVSIQGREDGGVIVTVVGIPGRTYSIERSYDLRDEYANWQTVATFQAPPNGLHTYQEGQLPQGDPMSGEPPVSARFFRVRYNQ